MLRIAVILAALNCVLVIGVGVFVVHGSARDGCAQANTSAALAWMAAQSADPAAGEIAAAHAADETVHAQELASAGLWIDDASQRVERRKLLRGVDGVRELAVRATALAVRVCQ
jgi:hypothetical protein